MPRPRTLTLALAVCAVSAQTWVDEVKSSFPINTPGATTSANPTCVYSETEACPIEAMPADSTTMVYPGGETRCIYSTSTDFAFQVVPGDSDKLMVYFQGGGACWDSASTKANACSSDANAASLTGLFDRTNDANPFKDHTIVHVLYCSGDLHAGNVTRSYTDRAGVPVTQSGAANTMAALEWAQRNTDATLSSLVVSGCSAGSIGTQIWAEYIAKTFSSKEMGVVVDSYAGVFPEGTMGPLVYDFGMCGVLESVDYGDEIMQLCEDQEITLQDVFEHAIIEQPEVAFANINSKADSTQMAFYAGIAATEHKLPLTLTQDEYADELNLILERYNGQPNYVSYLVTGTQHCYTPSSLTYTADTTGTRGRGQGGQKLMSTWLNEFPVLEGGSVETECDGDLLDQADWTGAAYCDAAQAGKVFTRQ